MRLFITGAGGCVGRAVVSDLLSGDHDITVLVHPDEAEGFCFRSESRIKQVVKDLNSVSAESIPPQAVVVHLAAQVHTVPKTAEEEEQFFHVNRDGTSRLAELARRRDAAGFIFTSTSNVYGNALSSSNCNEETTPNPMTAYGRSKLEAEQSLLSIFPREFPLIILRPAVLFGPGDRGNVVRLIRMAQKGVIPLIGGGTARKSVLYVEDLSRILTYIAAHLDDFSDFSLYNVSYPRPYTFQDIFHCLEDVLGIQCRKIVISLPLASFLARVGDAVGSAVGREMPISSRKLRVACQDALLDSERILKLLPRDFSLRSLEDGMRDYANSPEFPSADD